MTTSKKTILITGSNGRIGRFLSLNLAKHLTNEYQFVFLDIRSTKNNLEPFVKCDISNIQALRKVFIKHKIDFIIHLAAKSSKTTPWKSLVPNNIIGAFNIFQVASEFKCQRIIYASSFNAVDGDEKGTEKISNEIINPKNLYGATKGFGEIIAKLYSNSHKLSSIVIRLGKVINEKSKSVNQNRNRIIFYDDVAKLVAKSIEAPDTLKFFIVTGLNKWVFPF